MNFIIEKPMTVLFIIAGAMVLYQVWRQIAHNRREARRVAMDTFADATTAEKQQFERMI